MRAAIYARISDDTEGREAGVTRQVEDCRALVERTGWSLHPHEPFIDNDISASTKSTKRRPDYEEMVRLVEAGEIDGVVFYSNSRLTRRPREFEDWIELVNRTGVQLASVVSGKADLSTADGRMIARVLAAQDAAEAERISERVGRAFVQRREQGRPNPASRSFGYEKGGEIVVPAEAELIREAVERIVTEGWSLSQVVNDWNSRGIKTLRAGGGWSRTTVKRALTNPRAAGLVSLGGEIIGDGTHEAIISPLRREQVLAALSSNRNNAASYKQRQHVLAGFLVCGKCDKPMKVNALLEPDGVTLRKDSFIVCSRSQHGCGNVKRNYHHVWAYVDLLVRNRIAMFEPMGEAEITGDADDQTRALEAQLAEIVEDIAALKAAFAAREVRFKDYHADLAVLRSQQESTEQAIADTATRSKVDPDIDLLAVWEDEESGVEAKREVMAYVFDHITLHPVGRGLHRNRYLEMVPQTVIPTYRQR